MDYFGDEDSLIEKGLMVMNSTQNINILMELI